MHEWMKLDCKDMHRDMKRKFRRQTSISVHAISVTWHRLLPWESRRIEEILGSNEPRMTGHPMGHRGTVEREILMDRVIKLLIFFSRVFLPRCCFPRQTLSMGWRMFSNAAIFPRLGFMANQVPPSLPSCKSIPVGKKSWQINIITLSCRWIFSCESRMQRVKISRETEKRWWWWLLVVKRPI